MAEAISTVTECWIWYPIVIVVVFARFISQWLARRKNGSFLSILRPDDFIMVFAVCTYTAIMACLYTYDGLTNLDLDTMTDDEYSYYEHLECSILLASETLVQTTLWCIKICILFIYRYLTVFSGKNVTFTTLCVFIAGSYIVVITVLYTECQPFSNFFLWESGDEECQTWFRYNVTQLTLNLSTDISLVVAFWVTIAKLQLPLLKKVLLMGVFGLGLFGMVAAILTKWIVFSNITDEVNWTKWYIREVSTAMLVGNLALCFPLVVFVFRRFSIELGTITTKTQKSTFSAADKEQIKEAEDWDHIELHSQTSSRQSQDEFGTETVTGDEFDGGIRDVFESRVELDLEGGNGTSSLKAGEETNSESGQRRRTRKRERRDSQRSST